MEESNKDGSFFSENGNTSWPLLIAMGVISLIGAVYLGNHMGYKHNTHVSHYDISNITYQVEPMPDKLNLENMKNIFREIIKVNSTNTYNKIHNLNSQIEFKDSFYGYILKYYVDKGFSWSTRRSIEKGIIPSLKNAIRMLNAANKFIVNNPDAAIDTFLKYPSSLKDDKKLLEALHIVQIDINNAEETFELLGAKIGKQWGYALSNAVGAEDIKSLKKDIYYLLDDLIVNSDHIYGPNNKGDVGLKAILDGIVYDFKRRELVSGDTLKAFIMEADQLINKALGEPIKRSFLGELVPGYMSDVKKILSALDSKKPKGSSPMTLPDAKAELKNISNEYSDILNLAKDDMLKDILASDTLEVFSERMLIVTSVIAYELAHSAKKSSEVFKSEIISALIELMGKCKYGNQLSNVEEIKKEMKAVFVRKMERLNAISSEHLRDKTYPSWDAYAKEMKEVAHRDVETPKKAELKEIISSFERNFSISKYVTVFPRNLTMVGDLAVADISEYLELRILQYAIGSVSSSIEAVLDIKNQEAGNVVGGIDFTRINYLTRPMGSFLGLDLRLPLLSRAELEGMDINKELASVEQMINAKIDVSTDRLKRLLAAMSQKDAFTAQRETQLLPLLLRLCWLKEERGIETTPDFRAVLLIADTGLFMEQGNTKYSLN